MTKQTSDKLIYEANEYEVREELYLEEYIRKHFKIPPMGYYTTACHRMYHAVFEIKDNRLYMQEINNDKVEQPVLFTGSINLYDSYSYTFELQGDNTTLNMNNNLRLKVWLEDGIVKKSRKNE